MKIQLKELRRIIRESMVAIASKENPIMVWPKTGPSGDLMWIVKDGVRTAVINTATGEVHGNWLPENNEAFDAVVGALGEWYTLDRKSYDNENIDKIKKELESTST